MKSVTHKCESMSNIYSLAELSVRKINDSKVHSFATKLSQI